MKKIWILAATALICVVFVAVSFAAKGFDKNVFAKNVAETFKSRGQNVDVQVDVLKKMEAPAGFYFVKLTFKDKMNGQVAGEQYMFSDGEFVVQDFLYSKNMDSVGKNLAFEFTPKADIDVSKLSPVIGKAGAENIIVEVTDFQCPFCVEANAYLHKKLKGRDNVVVYLMHMPLRQIHPKADVLAKVFEAGTLMGHNFANDLYDKSNGELSDAQIIEKYAKKSGDSAKFKEHVSSKAVADKIKAAEAQAHALGIKATPAIFVNGKLITGLDIPLLDKAIGNFK